MPAAISSAGGRHHRMAPPPAPAGVLADAALSIADRSLLLLLLRRLSERQNTVPKPGWKDRTDPAAPVVVLIDGWVRVRADPESK